MTSMCLQVKPVVEQGTYPLTLDLHPSSLNIVVRKLKGAGCL